MLSDKNVYAMLPVDNMAKATKFYGETIGLKDAGLDPSGTGNYYLSGNTKIMVYESQFAGTNKGTAASWETDDVDKTVQELKEKGIKFEHYDFPGVTKEGDVHVMGEVRAAWFKDPAGNILGINN